jgi:DNA-binding transcriptional MerR regulator
MENRTKTYSIGEIAKLTSVSRRTVRFYVQLELIPPPLGVGRGNHYTDEHRELILKIRELQRDGVPLDQMCIALKGEPLEPAFEPERELVTRIKLYDGIWLEVAHGQKVPPSSILQKIVNLLKQVL